MATIEYWIQIENRPWDVCPRNIDRMRGQTIQDRESMPGQKAPAPEQVTITSPGSGKQRQVTMNKPLRDIDTGKVTDALILRRYARPITTGIPGHIVLPWTVPDDRKVNPWDYNEPDPTDSGTMGTIPGPVIECNVGDKVIVHFRNMDMREDAKGKKLQVLGRTHSLHPHGFAFLAAHDGAYPLSPPDTPTKLPNGQVVSDGQPVGSEEKPHWDDVVVTDFKKGDRVPPEGTFDYTWIAGAPSEGNAEIIEPWPTTAGVWLYHDHSVCDMDNVSLGAIGIIVIHNPNDPQDVDIRKPTAPTELDPNFLPGGSATGPVFWVPQKLPIGADGEYFPPPSKALYLQLFHQLTGLGDMAGMLINGRQYLGNTPTLIAGPATLMRFGVVAMGNDFHTFHIHGHRWAIPGPDGADPDTIQNSAEIRAVSQFEDTRIFGPANSFVFSIKEGEFFGARDDDPTGEFHMHCHVLMHMDMGMMGSLLILPDGGAFVYGLPIGKPCPLDVMAPMPSPGTKTIKVTSNAVKGSPNGSFKPDSLTVPSGSQVMFYFVNKGHSVQFKTFTNAKTILNITGDNNPKHTQIAVSAGAQKKVTVKKKQAGKAAQIQYQCGIHGSMMHGTIKIT